jgi:hypothetical protein
MKTIITTVALTLAIAMSFAVAEARPYRLAGQSAKYLRLAVDDR